MEIEVGRGGWSGGLVGGVPVASVEMLGAPGFRRPFSGCLDWTGLGLTIKYPGGTDTAGVAEEIPTGVYHRPDILRLSGGVGTVNIPAGARL